MNAETWKFKISAPPEKPFMSQEFVDYKVFIKECEKKCKELHAHEDDVSIFFTTEYGSTFVRRPEHGELAV